MSSENRFLDSASLSAAEGSTEFQIIVNATVLVFSGAREVVCVATLTLHLHVDVSEIVCGEAFTFGDGKSCLFSSCELFEPGTVITSGRGFVEIVKTGQKLVVCVVGLKLHRVLVVSEEGVVAVRLVSKVTALNGIISPTKNRNLQ